MNSVFNHYNRVRANLTALQDEEADEAWESSSEDRTLDDSDAGRSPRPTGSSARYPGVAPASVQPHPYRLPLPSMPLRSRHAIPLFEKSNVLVMYVSSLFTSLRAVTSEMYFLFVRSGPTGSGVHQTYVRARAQVNLSFSM